MLVILANCVCLAMYDPLDFNDTGPRNTAIARSGERSPEKITRVDSEHRESEIQHTTGRHARPHRTQRGRRGSRGAQQRGTRFVGAQPPSQHQQHPLPPSPSPPQTHSELPFNLIFTVEMVLKIVALGFVGKNTYLGDKWNWLDFFIVFIGYIGMIPGVANVSALRTFRVLRPLRTLSTMPGMRVIVGSILAAVPALGNVVLLALFTILVFGIIGIQLWSGLLRGQCGYADPNDPSGMTWVNTGAYCALDCAAQFAAGVDASDCTESYGDACPVVPAPFTTANGTDVMVAMAQSCVIGDNPTYGTVGFDNIGIAAMTIFTAITCEGWTDTMYAVMQTWGVRPLVAIYFCSLILFGAFFMLQLALAVIWESYQRSEQEETMKADVILAQWSHLLPVKKKAGGKTKSVANLLTSAGRTLLRTVSGRSSSGEKSPGGTAAGSSWPPELPPELHSASSTPQLLDLSALDAGAGGAKVRAGQVAPMPLPSAAVASAAAADSIPLPDHGTASDPKPASSSSSSGDADGESQLPAATSRSLPPLRLPSRPSGEADDVATSSPTAPPAADAGAAHGGTPPASTSLSPETTSATTGGEYEYDVEEEAPPGPPLEPLYAPLHKIVENPRFQNFIIFVIVLNTIQLAMPYKNMSSDYSYGLDVANFVFSGVFGVEMLMKLVGSGPRIYVSSAFNVFDGIVVVMSFVDITLTAVVGDSAGGLAALRTLRLARVFKLARSWAELRRLMGTILIAVSNVSNAVIVLLLMMFIFTLLGMQLIGGTYDALVASGTFEEKPRSNWDTFWWGLVSTFQVMTGENWNSLLGEAYVAIGGIAILYLFLVNIVGSYIFLNLFLAILLGCFEAEMDKEAEERALMEEAAKAAEEAERIAHAIEAAATGTTAEAGGAEPLAIADAPGAPEPPAPADADKTASSSPPPFMDAGELQMSDLRKAAAHAASSSASAHAAPGDPGRSASGNVPKNPSGSVDGVAAAGSGAAALSSTYLGGSGPVNKSSGSAGDPVVLESAAKMNMVGGDLRALQANLKVAGNDGQQKNIAIRVLASGDVQVAEVNAADEEAKKLPRWARAYRSMGVDSTPGPDGAYHAHQRSLFLFMPDSPIRRLAAVIVSHPWFDSFILLLILISSINLALDEPRVGYCKTLPSDDPKNCIALALYLKWTDIVITGFFVGEMAFKIFSLGFVHPSGAYLKNSWNVLDFVIVIISVLSLSLESAASQLKALRSLRALRALRPLRVVSRYPGLKLVVNAVLTAIPKVKSVVLINFLFMLLLAIVGLQNFSGALDYCNDPDVTDLSACTGTFSVTGDGCKMMPTPFAEDMCRNSTGTDFPRTVTTYPQNYDSVFNSIMTVFEVASGEAWPDIMNLAVDSVGPGKPMQRDYNPAAALYFIGIQLICGFFLLELFTGIVIANYDELKELNKGSGLLTAEQQLWVEQMKMMLTTRPKKQMVRPSWPHGSAAHARLFRKLRSLSYDLAVRPAFELFIMSVILCNTVVLAMKYYTQPLSYIDGIESANNAFAILFAGEALVKLLAFGPKQYFGANWNRFDFTLVIASAVGVAFSLGPLATLLRIFRVARIFRLIRTSKGLQLLFKTLIVSLPSLANVGTILVLLYYIFAIIGMNLFAGVRFGFSGLLNDEANFNSFFTAFLTLFRCSTGENYNGLMHDLEVQPPYCSEEDGTCGSTITPSIYFSLFMTLADMVLIKLLVAVVLDSFSDALSADEQVDEFRLTPDVLEHYTEVWQRCDPLATKLLDGNGMIKLIRELNYPLGLKNSPGIRHEASLRKQAVGFLTDLALQADASGKYQFHTVLQELVKRASGGKSLIDTTVEVGGKAQVGQYTYREQVAAIRIQGLFRARRARIRMQEQRRRVAAGEVLVPSEAEIDEINDMRSVKIFKRTGFKLTSFASKRFGLGGGAVALPPKGVFVPAGTFKPGLHTSAESRKVIAGDVAAGAFLRAAAVKAGAAMAGAGAGAGAGDATAVSSSPAPPPVAPIVVSPLPPTGSYFAGALALDETAPAATPASSRTTAPPSLPPPSSPARPSPLRAVLPAAAASDSSSETTVAPLLAPASPSSHEMGAVVALASPPRAPGADGGAGSEEGEVGPAPPHSMLSPLPEVRSERESEGGAGEEEDGAAPLSPGALPGALPSSGGADGAASPGVEWK
jgi:hypothetical protein